MDVLFLCGVFAKENEAEVIAQAKKSVEFSANQMQLKLIRGLKEVTDTQVISAPFIGHYPNQSRSLRFSGFTNPQYICRYVSFNNIWGFRNLSRARALKKAVRAFALDGNEEKLIIVYSAHDPFLAAAAYAQKLNPKIRICFIVPDLPQYMNLEAKRGFLYNFFKGFDIKSIKEHIKCVDTSVVLTEAMAKALQLTDRPYVVAEGIVDSIPENRNSTAHAETVNIVYAGKLYFRFGIRSLVEAFSLLQDSSYRLILCGNGDAVEYLQKCAMEDSRIILLGQVSPEKVQEYISSAAVLVNPRPNNEEYTKYSFPSKDIEYLSSGKPTVAFLLDGMPKCYQDFLYVVDPNRDISCAISDALKAVGAKSGVAIPQEGSVAAQALAKIAKIYHLEGLLKDFSPEERLRRRQKEIAPLVEAYFAWVKEQNPLQIGSKKTCDGLAYSLNQEKQLKMFLCDGEIPIDNSASERAIRPFTVGRKNWMMLNTPRGAQSSAILYSIAETAKANNLKPYTMPHAGANGEHNTCWYTKRHQVCLCLFRCIKRRGKIHIHIMVQAEDSFPARGRWFHQPRIATKVAEIVWGKWTYFKRFHIFLL